MFAADKYSRDLKESFQKIKEAISIEQQKQNAAANKHRRALAFKENDWVLLKFPKAQLRHTTGKNPTGHQKYYAKLAKRYYGPFQILKPINDMAYQLKLPNHWLIHNAFHVSLLKPYKGEPPKEAITEDPPEVEGQEEVLQPESVLRHEDKLSSYNSECNGSGGDHGGRGKIFLHVLEDAFAPGDMENLFNLHVTPAMKENLFNLIAELREKVHPPTCLISDSFIPWTLEVTQRASIPRIEFWTSNAMGNLLVSNIGVLYSEGIFPEKGSPTQWKRDPPLMLSNIPGVPPFSSEAYPNFVRFADSSNEFAQLLLKVASCVNSRETILINSLLELEPEAFKSFEVQGIPSYAIGPLPTQTKAEDDVQTECLSWLDSQAESYVIYIAFGSVAKLSVEEIQELAVGLEGSGNPFLWVIREDFATVEELPQVLPEGFLERIRGKGMIISWASQVKVLAHKAIGGFLSHCGWNSTMESLWAGVPILCCPRFAEQRLNCHYLCNVWGAGLELGRTETGGLERSFVEVGVKALLHEEEGHKARSKAQEIMHIIEKTSQKGGQSFSNLQKFYDVMRALCSKLSSK
ncbi:hypothetical protein L7F22_069391 [Adiantum nelumboides]|nr:hypothetical protein [Adiantum nelumboides]